jgi:hypothetical protein
MWFYFAAIMLVAVAGKFGGSTVSARITGLTWREASALGILMNTRGLMELVILTIGLELGVISPALFAMMVLMALITTAMTQPVLELLYPERMLHESLLTEEEVGEYNILIPLALPSAGPGLFDAAMLLVPPERQPRVYALHLIAAEGGPLRRTAPDQDVFGPLIRHARERGIVFRPLSLFSRDFKKDILDVARVKRAQLIVTGWHKPVFRVNILRGTVGTLLHKADADVGVFVERTPAPWRHVLLSRNDGTADPVLRAEQNLKNTGEATVTWREDGSRVEPRGERSRSAGAGGVGTVAVRPAAERRPRDGDGGYDLIIASLPPGVLDLDESTLARAAGAPGGMGRASVLLLRGRNTGAAAQERIPEKSGQRELVEK